MTKKNVVVEESRVESDGWKSHRYGGGADKKIAGVTLRFDYMDKGGYRASIPQLHYEGKTREFAAEAKADAILALRVFSRSLQDALAKEPA